MLITANYDLKPILKLWGGKWNELYCWDCLSFKPCCFWLMLTHFPCSVEGCVSCELANALFRNPLLSLLQGEVKVEFHGPCACSDSYRTWSIICKDRRQLCDTHILISIDFLFLITHLLNIGLKYKLKNMSERMYSRRLCMYIQDVKKPFIFILKNALN